MGMTLMIPLGAVTFSPTEVAVLLTCAGMAGASQLGLGWLGIPVGWLPTLAVAALARPSRGLGWSEVRRPVGER